MESRKENEANFDPPKTDLPSYARSEPTLGGVHVNSRESAGAVSYPSEKCPTYPEPIKAKSLFPALLAATSSPPDATNNKTSLDFLKKGHTTPDEHVEMV